MSSLSLVVLVAILREADETCDAKTRLACNFFRIPLVLDLFMPTAGKRPSSAGTSLPKLLQVDGAAVILTRSAVAPLNRR